MFGWQLYSQFKLKYSQCWGFWIHKQCHFYHPWLGMVIIPPIKMVIFLDGKPGLVLSIFSCFFSSTIGTISQSQTPAQGTRAATRPPVRCRRSSGQSGWRHPHGATVQGLLERKLDLGGETMGKPIHLLKWLYPYATHGGAKYLQYLPTKLADF